jgi:hypothetical protein
MLKNRSHTLFLARALACAVLRAGLSSQPLVTLR